MVAVLHDKKLNIANSVRTERRGKRLTPFKGKSEKRKVKNPIDLLKVKR